ncbi:aminotransferase [Parasitella parasitica]|nr:aminotransferase [Parasitella parasitica]
MNTTHTHTKERKWLIFAGVGFYLLEQHLRRLQNAIEDFQKLDSTLFQKNLSTQAIIDHLNSNVPKNGAYQRVRLLVDTDSNITVEHTQLPTPVSSYESLEEAAASTTNVSIVLDTKPFDLATNDPFVVHKTTRRDMYNLSRERTHCDWHAPAHEPFDVVLWNKEGNVTETSITNIAVRFVVDGRYIWKTPKIECGVLPGVFRSFLLQNEELIEDVITIQELIEAQEVSFIYAYIYIYTACSNDD